MSDVRVFLMQVAMNELVFSIVGLLLLAWLRFH